MFDVFSQALHWVLGKCKGCQGIVHYLDDFLLLVAHLRMSLTERFADLNVPLALRKVEGMANIIHFLGIMLDSNLMVASLPREKLVRICHIINLFVRSPVCRRKSYSLSWAC